MLHLHTITCTLPHLLVVHTIKHGTMLDHLSLCFVLPQLHYQHVSPPAGSPHHHTQHSAGPPLTLLCPASTPLPACFLTCWQSTPSDTVQHWTLSHPAPPLLHCLMGPHSKNCCQLTPIKTAQCWTLSLLTPSSESLPQHLLAANADKHIHLHLYSIT